MIDSVRFPRFSRSLFGALCATLALSLALPALAQEPAKAPAEQAKTPATTPAKPAKATASKAKAPAEAAAPSGPPPADSSPMADLKKSNASLKKVLQKQSPSWSPERDARNSEVRKVVGQFLDFEELSRRSLAKHWDALSAKQRTDFVATLRELVESNYINQIHGKPDYDLRFDKETKEGNEATVSSTLVTSGPKGKKVNIALEYKMIYKGGHWVVYDVITDEQSLLENYRAEFNKIIQKDGFDALLKRMRKKLDEKKPQ
jgi:phospholipid transport system substrate-binding protein